MRNAKRRIWMLVVGALVTLVWLLLCPKYVVVGQVRHEYLVGNSNTAQGAHYEERSHPEPTYFWGGVAIIAAGMMAWYQFLILKDTGKPEEAVKEEEEAGREPNEA